VGCDLREVPCGGIVIVIVQAVRVDEMRVARTPLGGAFVHELNEILDRSRYRFTNRCRRVIGGPDQHGLHQVAEGYLLAFLEVQPGLVHVRNRLGDRHDAVHVAVLNGQRAGHHLREAGRVHARVGVLAPQFEPGVQVHHDRRFSSNIRRFCRAFAGHCHRGRRSAGA